MKVMVALCGNLKTKIPSPAKAGGQVLLPVEKIKLAPGLRRGRSIAWPLAACTLALTVDIGNTHAADTRKSGFDFMSPATQAMQKDDTQNPAMLWVKDGEALWNKACNKWQILRELPQRRGQEHEGQSRRLTPRSTQQSKRPVNLSERINLCRKNKQSAQPLPPEHQDLLSLESYVALQSRGMAIAPTRDKRMAEFFVRGEKSVQAAHRPA